MNADRLSYRFGPLERRGLLGPLRLGQVATIGGALLLGVELLDRVGGGPGVLAAMLVLGAAVALATTAGRGPDARGMGARRLRRHGLRGPRGKARLPPRRLLIAGRAGAWPALIAGQDTLRVGSSW